VEGARGTSGRSRANEPTETTDVAIVGGGIVGLATALRLGEARPDLGITVVEKEMELATHQTGHNSGVLHAGLYYAAGSLKARLSTEGRVELERFCEAHDVPVRRVGKLVVALDDEELPRLEAIFERAVANGVPGVERVGPERLREIEPHGVGVGAIWSPATGVVDFRRVALAYGDVVRAREGRIDTGRRVTGIAEEAGVVRLDTDRGPLVARGAVVAAGLQSDRVAEMAGAGGPAAPRIVPFRGDYYSLVPDARHLVRGMIYPGPDPRFPFLGVHLNRRIDGSVWVGPNAVLALARERYGRAAFSPRDALDAVTHRGFLRFAGRNWRTGLAELWRDWSKRSFHAAVARYVPELRAEDLVAGPSGIRAQAVNLDGSLVDDFDIGGRGRVLIVRNAPSPAATSSLAIGRLIADRAIERLGL
jgi:L-2-hydroxyglutarate oxidase LhgO